MSEIEQLRQDIEKLEAAQNLIADGDGNGSWLLHDNIVERKKQLAKLEAEENRKGSKMKWTYSGEGEWSMPSAYHDDGLSFQWRIGVCEDGTFCVSGSDPELTRCRETLPTLAEAKIFCESIEQQIREPGSRCNLELPLDAAAAQARIAELEAELAKLEAEAAEKADRWADAKRAVKRWEQTIANYGVKSTNGDVCEYVRNLEQRVAELEKQLASEKQQVDNVDSMAYVFLNDLEKAQARIAELEAQLAKRPVVYCLRNKATGKYNQFTIHAGIALYDRNDFATFDQWEFEPYTGEQS